MKLLIVCKIHLSLPKQFWNASCDIFDQIGSILAELQEQARQEAEEDGNESEEGWLFVE